MLRSVLVFIAFIACSIASAQNGSISGVVIDKNAQTALVGATVLIENTELGAITDVDGKFSIEKIHPGTYNVRISLLNFLPAELFNVVVTNGNTNTFSVELERSSEQLNTLEIKRYTYGKATETPLSVQSLTAEEIRSNPGGNFDISKVIQALPGVGGLSGAGERNDLLIRGGAPSENVYYLDGIEAVSYTHLRAHET
jgi:hypothetical protein